MASKTKYKITIENESRLEKVTEWSFRSVTLLLFLFSSLIFIIGISVLLLAASPIKNLLPGYLKPAERAATEEQHLRLDSLLDIYDINETYIRNITEILKRDDATSTNEISEVRVPLTIDSLLDSSEEEKEFYQRINEREKYNVSVIAPLAAENITFSPVNSESVITEETKGAVKANVILSKGASINAIADGKIIAVTKTLYGNEGNAVIIQHANGFLSRCSRLGKVLIEEGESVILGQAIALQSLNQEFNPQHISVELWHNGNRLIPSDYISKEKKQPESIPLIDVNKGRGRL